MALKAAARPLSNLPRQIGTDLMNDITRLVDITMPRLGETVIEGTITRWFKREGDVVEVDEALFEVSTDKVDTEVPSPVTGVVKEILAEEGEEVEVGQVLARVSDPSSATPPPADPPSEKPALTVDVQPEVASVMEGDVGDVAGEPSTADPQPETATPQTESTSVPANVGLVMSPLVRRLIADNNLDPTAITGTGVGGRITRADVEQEIRANANTERSGVRARDDQEMAESASAQPSPVQQDPPPPQQKPESRRSPSRGSRGRNDRTIPLNNIRKRTAEHMVMSKRTSPHVLTAVEVDYEAVESARRRVREMWKTEEGFNLTYLPFIARAVVDALHEYPYMNASFSDDELVIHGQVNLAVAVDIDFQGLLAPVIHGADGKRLRLIAREIADLAERTRSRRLTPDDLSAGTFTITNAGSYGTMLQFPIINQPQVAIISTDGISRKPVVVDDGSGGEAIAIHSVGVLAMAWDHRAFDGAYAAAFLHKVRQIIETRDWEAEIR